MKASKTVTISLILCVLFAILARATGIVYSYLATNVIYAESVIVQLLPALRQVLSALSFACAAGAAVCAFATGKRARHAVLVYGAVALADGAAVILIDVFSGVFTDEPGRLLFGIGYRLGLAAYSVMMLIIGLALARAMMKRGGAIGVSAITAAVLPAAVDLISVLWKSIASLIEWEFMPYAGEIWTMLFEIGVVLLSGVLSAVVTAVAVMNREK